MHLFSINNTIINKTSNTLPRKPVIVSKIGSTGLVYGSTGNTASRSNFQKSEYNLGEISKVMDIEAYVRQAFNKHVELCLKEGYEISSRDNDATRYIKKRLQEITDRSGITFNMLLRVIMQNIVAYSNAFIVKVRDITKSSGRPIYRQGNVPLQPVAAYFPLDPTSIEIKRDFHGKILKYVQKVPNNPIIPEFKPENIVHVYYDRKEGFAFGTPYVIPALDDIRTLRRMEENVEMLITQHIFPLYHYSVGTEENPAEIYDDGSTEVDLVRQQVEDMPTEGSIVTPERHKIVAIGAEGEALDVEKYLQYFEKRVLAGLGISEIALGRGGTANRSTATTIDKMMTDRCKDFQDVAESFINEHIFKELLLEGGILLDETEDTFVKLKFNEIDIDSMLKVQNHSVFKYEHDAITESEMREELGMDSVRDEQREDMYFERVSKPKAIIMAVDEPFTAEAKGASISKISKEEKKKKETINREKPANQHGSKPAKTREKKDELLKESINDIQNIITPQKDNTLLEEQKISNKRKGKNKNLSLLLFNDIYHQWDLTKKDILDYIEDDSFSYNDLSKNKFNIIFKMTKDSIFSRIQIIAMQSIQNGIDDQKDDVNTTSSISYIDRYKFISDNITLKIEGLFDELGNLLVHNLKKVRIKNSDLKYTTNGIFESLKHKIKSIMIDGLESSYQFGYTPRIGE